MGKPGSFRPDPGLPDELFGVNIEDEDPPPTNPEREVELQRVFKTLDKNGNGHIELNEMQAALQDLGLPCSKMYIRDLMNQYDTNNDGQISFQEFKRYVDRKEHSMWHAFRRVDANKSGELDAAELVDAIRGMGVPLTERDAHKMIALLDVDGNQQISYDEFRRFVVMLPGSQVSSKNIMYAWVDSADWMDGVEFRLNNIPPNQPYERLLAGGIAGAVSRTVVAPLERLRTIMMADASAKGILPTFRRMWLDGGIKGLFKGNLATVVKVFPQNAIQFAVYDSLKDRMLGSSQDLAKSGGQDLSSAQKLGAGWVAGATATCLTYPMEMMRTQVCMDGSKGNYLSMARHMIAQKGVGGLYQGFSAGLLNNALTHALGFYWYETMCQSYKVHLNDGVPPTTSMRGVLGGASAVVVMASTMPLEVVMRRMQVQGSPGFPRQYKNTADCVLQIARKEGITAFWRGSLGSYMKVVPSIAAVRFLYEGIVAWWGIGGIRRYRLPSEQGG